MKYTQNVDVNKLGTLVPLDFGEDQTEWNPVNLS